MPQNAQLYDYDILSENSVKDNVLPHYDLNFSTVTQVKFKDTNKQRAVYKIEYLDKFYCLKKVYYNVDELLFIYSAIEWLYRNGIHVSKILPTKDNNRFVKFNDMLFILTPWIFGEKCNFDDIQNILDSTLNLAKMHKCTQNFSPIKGSILRESYDKIYFSFHKHFNQLLYCSNQAFIHKDKFSKLFLSGFEENINLAEKSVEIASTIDENNLHKALCHFDYVNKNIIFDSSNNVCVIDFDKCSMGYCVSDICYFLRRLLRRNNTKWNLEIAMNSLNEYEKIKPLNFDEYKYIYSYLIYPQKYWKISRDYYNNIKKCNKNSFVILLSKYMEKTQDQIIFAKDFKNFIEKKFHKKLNQT